MACQLRLTSSVVVSVHVAEHMRMTADHFVGDMSNHVCQQKTLFIGSDLRIQNHLQQHVAQFFANGTVVVRIDRFEQFVGFFQSVWFDRLHCLLTIPWTSIRRSKTSDDFAEPPKFREQCIKFRRRSRAEESTSGLRQAVTTSVVPCAATGFVFR